MSRQIKINILKSLEENIHVVKYLQAHKAEFISRLNISISARIKMKKIQLYIPLTIKFGTSRRRLAMQQYLQFILQEDTLISKLFDFLRIREK